MNHGIFNLPLGKYPLKESLSPPLLSLFYTADINNINPNAYNQDVTFMNVNDEKNIPVYAQKCPVARKDSEFEARRTVLYVEPQILSPDAARPIAGTS